MSSRKNAGLLLLAVLAGGMLAGCAAEDNSIGIIGGADGPTAIFTTRNPTSSILPSLLFGLMVLCVLAAAIFSVVQFFRKPPKQDTTALEKRIAEELRAARQEINAGVNEAVRSAAAMQSESQKRTTEAQGAHLETLSRQVAQQRAAFDEQFAKFSMQNEQKLENIRRTMEKGIADLQAGNEKKLEEMRHTVDEKLQQTLNERLKQSFSLVSESLAKVQQGLGEMQNLANGVGDLKKVLSNVKTRGILGEIQLGAILEEILPPEQYAANVATVNGSTERVEYAVKLPGDGDGTPVWLPIDAKFPADAYANLLDAYEAADTAAVDAAGKTLENRIRLFAKDIRDKYIHVPETTEFGIMFLPVEGLYAEVVRRGLVEKLQSEYKVNIAGPTTMAALLNSLQMGFRTLAIQKRSGEVWKVLGEVKSEFAKFGEVLTKTKRHLELASKDIDELVGTRTNQIQRKLRDVTSIGAGDEAVDVDGDDDLLLEEEAAAGAE